MKFFLFFLVFLSGTLIFPQGLFEDAISGGNEDGGGGNEVAYELNGYMRGVFYGGKIVDKDSKFVWNCLNEYEE